MFAYIVRRLALMLVTLIGISIIIFVLLRVVPGNIVDILFDAAGFVDPADKANLEKELGLNLPLYVQYLHWIGGLLVRQAGDLPPRAFAELRAFMAQVPHVTSAARETEALLQFTFPQVRRARDFADRPLVVLSATTNSIGGDRIHEEMAGLSSNSRHVSVGGASHGSIVTEAKYARVVSDATRLVVDAVRQGRSLETRSRPA